MESDSPSQRPPFKDRSIGLTLFGIMTILVGALAALFSLLGAVGMVTASFRHVHPTSTLLSAFLCLGYLAIAALLVWLGIGSCQARRWARACLLVLSWFFLIMGLSGLLSLVLLMPQIEEIVSHASSPGHSSISPETTTAILIVAIVVEILFCIGGPLIWIFFYSGKNVRATCEARDPVERWTDRTPLPVLAASAWLILQQGFVLTSIVAAPRSAFPFFGTYVTGPVAAGISLLVAGLSVYAGIELYRLRKRGWWTAVGTIAFSFSAWVFTIPFKTADDYYRALGYSSARISHLHKLGLSQMNHNIWPAASLWYVFAIGYFIFLRRYLKEPSKPNPVEAPVIEPLRHSD